MCLPDVDMLSSDSQPAVLHYFAGIIVDVANLFWGLRLLSH